MPKALLQRITSRGEKAWTSFEIGDTIFRVRNWLGKQIKHPCQSSRPSRHTEFLHFPITATLQAACTYSLKLVQPAPNWTRRWGELWLGKLCQSWHAVAKQLLSVLDKVKAKGKYLIWKSFRKALRSVWNKKDIAALEQQLARYKDKFRLARCTGLEVSQKNRKS